MNCNTNQNEIGGKSLLLKACKEVTLATTTGTADIALTANGLVLGDLVRFEDVGSITTFEINQIYFVVLAATNTFRLSATLGGSAIVPDHTQASLASEIFQNIGGIKTKSISFKVKGIDVTNQDSDEWTNMLDNAGVRSLDIAGSGVYNASTVFETVRANAFNNVLQCLAFIDVIQGKIYDGCFKITALQVGGSFDAEGTFSITASSSGIVNFTDAA